MATKPTKVTLSPRPSRLNPDTFPALADSGLEYQATTLPDYTDAVADFVDEQADNALAAAVAAAAGSLDPAERETFAGYLVGIEATTPFDLEPVEIVEYPELTQVQVEDDTSTVFGAISGQRLAQGSRLFQISRTVISGSPSVIDITFDPNDFDEIIITLGNVEMSTDGNQIEAKTSSDSGSTFDAGATDYRWERVDLTGGILSASNSTGAPDLSLMLSNIGNDTDEDGVSGSIRVLHPGITKRTRVFSDLFYIRLDGAMCNAKLYGERQEAAIVNALRLELTGGTFASGVISVHGVRS